MAKWRSKATKAVQAGKSASVRFNSDIIPFVLQGAISGALEECQTADEVDRVIYERVEWIPVMIRIRREIKFLMHEDEALALADYAAGELRELIPQAYLIVRQELMRLGYLNDKLEYVPRNLDDFRDTDLNQGE